MKGRAPLQFTISFSLFCLFFLHYKFEGEYNFIQTSLFVLQMLEIVSVYFYLFSHVIIPPALTKCHTEVQCNFNFLQTFLYVLQTLKLQLQVYAFTFLVTWPYHRLGLSAIHTLFG